MLRARDYRQKAREALSGNWGTAIGTGFAVQAINFILVLIVYMVLLANASLQITGDMSYTDYPQVIISPKGYLEYMLALIVVQFVMYALLVGYLYFNVNLVRRESFQFNNVFSRFNIILKIFGLYFMMGLFILLWSFLFVIPGIIASFRYCMAPYIMADNPEIGIMDAIRESKEMMNGYKWKYFCLQFSFIGWALLSIVTFGIGLLWVMPYMQAANAAFYVQVSGQNTTYEYSLDDE
ncbi:DUF975 family protein [Anaerocolumna xylanovorans]|uniref:Uncharacterized protein family (UPF0259) n=1 Tax=Anaerocolumna xylanovorans DSM 12503 TaxID=1121345 RepID=A0A1M7YGW3_9FIRM|nr:DUF975 family protein [Anaerocolumna xylanovorans]SHO51894.1 Uncharacterised protein family (UPF0259) [Anaerocolumna xylanovorans DSM 12503]